MPETNYFAKIGQAVCRGLARGELQTHISGPMARDQNSMRPMARGPLYGDQENLDPRGATMQSMFNGNGNQEPPSADDLIQMIRLCISKLPAGEQESFLAQLTNLVSTADPTAGDEGLPSNNLGALDRSRSGRRVTAQDRALRERNSRSFDQRWGSLMGGVSIDMMPGHRSR
jgi:hypothetical protein